MELFDNLALGFSIALTPSNLLFCLLGGLIGTLIGVLPGLGAVPTLAMLLPITFFLPPISAMIMLAGIYYGSQYGGSTTAILMNVPGESPSIVTCIDGHAMARRGRAGAALAIAACGSFLAGTIATIVIAVASPPLARIAMQFGPPEYFSLMVFGLVGAIALAQASAWKAILMVLTGLLTGLIGTDLNSSAQRYVFGIPELADGIGFVAIAMGLLGVKEIIANLENHESRPMNIAVGSLMPSRDEIRRAIPASLRGTLVGSLLGILPGGGALLSSFASYVLEKNIAKDPSRFGQGAVEGLAGPESANNAGAQTSFIPMLTLGVPSNPVMAVMIGSLMIVGITPGPRIVIDQPQLFWGLIASMWVGNLMLLIINLPLIGIWVKMLQVPYRLLYPAILLIIAIGAYSVTFSTFDVLMTALFGLIGYVFHKLGCEPAPFALGFILGPLMEENLRRAMIMSRGDPVTFVSSPISLGFLLATLGLFVLLILPAIRKTRNVAFADE